MQQTRISYFVKKTYLLVRELRRGMAIALCLLLCVGCRPGKGNGQGPKANVAEILSDSARIELRYAKNFSVHYLPDGVRLVDIHVADFHRHTGNSELNTP